MITWLLAHGDSLTEGQLWRYTCATLRGRIKALAPAKQFQAVADGAKHGVIVVYLPVAHPELNPIELVWAQVKGRVRRGNTSFVLSTVQKLGTQIVRDVTAADWAAATLHCIKEETKLYDADIQRDEQQQQELANSQADGDDDESWAEDESEDADEEDDA